MKKGQEYFYKRMCACAGGGKFFSSHIFLKLVRIRIKQSKSLKYEKSEKQTFEISIWVKNWQNN